MNFIRAAKLKFRLKSHVIFIFICRAYRSGTVYFPVLFQAIYNQAKRHSEYDNMSYGLVTIGQKMWPILALNNPRFVTLILKHLN